MNIDLSLSLMGCLMVLGVIIFAFTKQFQLAYILVCVGGFAMFILILINHIQRLK